MKIILPGGSGQLGNLLARRFFSAGHEVVVLSRRPGAAPWRVMGWDAQTVGPWAAELEEADAVINLAGRSVNCRYTPQHRREILESRVQSTRAVGQAIAACRHPPRVWLQASTATIYAHRYDAPNDDVAGELGGREPAAPPAWRFSIEVATAWEAAARAFAHLPTRQVLLRSAVVMLPAREGPFAILYRLARLGLGGRNGDGRQYVSWIHDADFTAAIDWLMARQDLAGAINLAAPQPLPNDDFMRLLRRACGARLGLPAPEPLLRVGAWMLGTETELVLKSRRVTPRRLLESGFAFRFPAWETAAEDLCRRMRGENAGYFSTQVGGG